MGYIFWGTILTFIDIRIFIDILPDFLGYVLIAYGMKELSDQSVSMARGWPLAAGAGILFFLMYFGKDGSTVQFWGNIIGTTMMIYAYYCVVKGVGELEVQLQRDLKGTSLWQTWCVLMVTQISLMVLTLLQADATIVLAVIVSVVGFVTSIVFAVRLYHCWKALEETV